MADQAKECKSVDPDVPIIKIKFTGLSKASSKIYGLFVAPMKKIFFFAPTPSISVKS